MNTTLLRTTARPPGEPCRHDALDSIGHDLWRCRLCNAEITGLGLLEEKHARHNKKTPGALTPGGTAETQSTKDNKPDTILPQLPPCCKGVGL